MHILKTKSKDIKNNLFSYKWVPMELIQELEMTSEKIIEEFNSKIKIWSFKTNSDYSWGKFRNFKKKMVISWKKINHLKKNLGKWKREIINKPNNIEKKLVDLLKTQVFLSLFRFISCCKGIEVKFHKKRCLKFG